jgi:nitrite reductase/ring-hydroxylating ferredoxin subunit
LSTTHHIQLCAADEIQPDSARGFSSTQTGAPYEIFVVHKRGHYFGYINSCPHTGAPLEWMPDQFLSLDGDHIQCSLHGARFTIDQGRCIQGPCLGQGLSPVEITVQNGFICWQLPETAENTGQ